MNDFWERIAAFFSDEWGARLFRSTVIVALGFVSAKFLGVLVQRVLARRFTPQSAMLARRGMLYLAFFITLGTLMQQWNIDMTVFLGTAGILTVAVGFASQTSVSNLISGLFLIGERPFVLGDLIKVGETVGEVISIDPLSVKVRTMDNLFVRFPNESLIKTQITNFTYYPIRRLDFEIGVAYKESIPDVRKILLEVADRNPMSLDEPVPLVIFKGFGESALNFQFSVWIKRENFLEMRNQIPEQVKHAFDAAGIEIPFPHRSLYAGSASEPFPVRIVSEPMKA